MLLLFFCRVVKAHITLVNSNMENDMLGMSIIIISQNAQKLVTDMALAGSGYSMEGERENEG